MRKVQKCLILLFVGLCLSVLIGCSSTQSNSVADEKFRAEAQSIIPANAFVFSSSQYSANEFQSYWNFIGNASINSQIYIYRYDDYLFALVSRISMPEGEMETFVLTQEQGETFLNSAEKYIELENKEKQNPKAVGNVEHMSQLNVGNKTIDIRPLDLSSLDLELSTAEELISGSSSTNFEVREAAADAFSEFVGKCKLTSWSVQSYYSCIGHQVLQHCGSSMSSIESVKVGTDDSIMEVVLEDGTRCSFLVTNYGYVVSVLY